MEVNFTLEEVEEVARKLLADTAVGSGQRAVDSMVNANCFLPTANRLRYKVFAFHGEMGAGKTTFIHAICEALGVKDAVTSPTFSIINQYKTNDGQTVYHMDLYRIKDENEAINAGIEDCLYSGDICLVEWPDKAPGIFPEDTLQLTLTSIDDNTRKLKFNL